VPECKARDQATTGVFAKPLDWNIKWNQDSFHRDLQEPVTLSEAYLHQLFYNVSAEICIVNNNVVNAVKVSLAILCILGVHKVLPFPMKVKDTSKKYSFIQLEKEYIMFDTTKQFYVSWHRNGLWMCKKISNKGLVSTKDFPRKYFRIKEILRLHWETIHGSS
jgi:hypothetical protein